MVATPTEVRKTTGGAGLKITWDDGVKTEASALDLRKNCHCAACRNELTGEIVLDTTRLPADIKILKMELIGNYAIGLQFSDGHQTGIYTFEMLRNVAAS